MYEFIGRVDQQVKIRGFRVELGEIESHLNRLPSVRESVVVLKTDAADHPALIAFCVPMDHDVRTLSSEALSGQLKGKLPDYMIPARFETLTALPLTPNRKVDRKFLTQAGDLEILEKFGLSPVTNNSAGTPESSRPLLGEVLRELRLLTVGILQADEAGLDPHRPLVELGFDSIRFTSLSVALNRTFGLQIDATLFYHCKTLHGVAEFLLLHHSEGVTQRYRLAIQSKTDSRDISDFLQGPEDSRSRQVEYRAVEIDSEGSFPTNAPVEPIAVIGMDARLPEAGDLETFWQNLTSGRDVIRQFPWERIDRRPADSDLPIWGGFIENVDKFDAPFFGISRREASAMDPRQRLFLETVWRAIEQSGYRPGELSGTNTGVFVGIVGGPEYSGESDDGSVDSAAQLLLGAASSLIANRISYHLNLRGPSAPIDTACSSSLVALHRAVVALQSGQCDLAVAGGVNLILDPEISRAGAKTGMLSPDGRCKAFDARADGYVRGEGVVALLLKPFSKARAAGDPILAIIRGSAENHGGRAAGLTVPNPEAQSEVVAAALQRAGIDPATLTYIETHGTGTQIGDPIEISGLKAAFDKARLAGQPVRTGHCGLGSVKTNIGHLEAAAGLAGVVKVLLAFHHGEIPANLHFQSRNPKIRLEGSPFFIVDRKLPWTRLKDHQGKEIPRRAGVSSFGFSGVNAHVVIEECLQSAERVVAGAVTVDKPVLIVLSARTIDRLLALASNLAGHLDRTAAGGGVAALVDIAYTLQVGREAMAERIAFVADSLAEVCQKLRQVAHSPEMATFRGSAGDKERLGNLLEGEAGESFLRLLVDNRDWARLGKLWVSGIEVDWKLLYPGTEPRRLSLPAYPFDRRRYWLPPRKPLQQMVTLGPLLDEPIPDWELGGIFVKRFGTAERVLAEHRVAGRSILPAAAFLEMVRTAAASMVRNQSVQFNSIVWLRPLEDSRAAETQVRLRREEEQTRFTVESHSDGERWVHAQGEIRYVSKPDQPENIDLPAIRRRCLHELEGPKLYERFVQAGMEYGPYFQSLEHLWIGDDEALGKLRLPPLCEEERGSYLLHPSLLDGALQTAAGSTFVTDSVEVRLPFSVDRVDIFGPLEKEVWVYVCRAHETSLLLADVEGRVAVRFSDYQTRPMRDPVSAERSAKPASSSVLGDALRNVESMPETGFGLDPATVDFECRGFALLEKLGCLALLKTLQKIGIFRTAGEEVDRESLRRALSAIPKYYRLCDTLVYFLKQGGFLEEAEGGLRAAASLARPETQRALADLELEQERYCREFPDLTPHGTLLWNCVNALPQVISGEIPATDVMFPNGSVELVSGIYRGTLLTDYFNRLAGVTVRECIAAALHHGVARSVRILEVGAGSGATTGFVAEAIGEFADRIEYVYTDVSLAFKRHGQRTFGSRYPFMRFELLDIEKQVAVQGLTPESFDIVLGANVVHTTRILRRSLQTIKALLKRNGVFVLLEGTEARIFNSLTYGLLDGWWNFQDIERRIENAPLLTIAQWHTALTEEGFRGVQVLGRSSAGATRLFQAVFVGESDGVFSSEAVGNAAPVRQAQHSLSRSTPTVTPRVPPPSAVDPKRILTNKVIDVVQEVLQAESEELRAEDTFESLGVDSILSVEIVEKLNARLPIKLRSTDLFNYPTITKLVERARELLTDDGHQQLIAETSPVSQPAVPKDLSAASPSAISSMAADTLRTMSANREIPIDSPVSVAIVGFSGQFPGASNVAEFWANLRAGNDAVREVPTDRWSLAEFYSEDAKSAVKSYCKWGGFLPDAASFDPLFFNLSPREAELMDPQQRLFLMESWRALEDAGYSDRGLDAVRCGVFVGCGASDYEHRLRTAGDWAESHAFLGNASAILSARIAYHLNLKGPSMAIDTACSSSLVAIHLACEALRARTVELALAGGVTVICTERFHIWSSRLGMLSSIGRCQAFAQEADGFVPAEGVGVLVLKRLDDALRDGDRIHGIIRGFGVNQDGKTNGITAPSAPSQTALETGIYEKFDVNPETIGYVECHGTGTKLGDPIEIDALTDTFRHFTNKTNFCAVGSVKSNIGHALSAAGVASVIKVLLALKHGELPPTLHCEHTNEHIDFAGSPFFVNRELREWRRTEGQIRRAAVSSFGFSGTNAHLVIEEAPAISIVASELKPAYLITLSGRTQTALRQRLEMLSEWLDTSTDAATTLEAVSYTLNAGRSHFENRCALVVSSLSELRESLQRVLAGEMPSHYLTSARNWNSLGNAADSGTDFRTGRAEWSRLNSGRPDLYLEELRRLAADYIMGAEIDWNNLHQGETKRRVSLPTYPFERRAFWFNSTKNRLAVRPKGAFGPLLDEPVPNWEAGGLFVKRFDPDERVLAEHQVSGRPILPGVAHLEMVYEAAQALSPGRHVMLCSVVWLRPLKAGNVALEVYVRLRQEGGLTRFTVESRHDSVPVIYSQGEVRYMDGPAPAERLDLDALRRQSGREFERETVYQRFAQAGLVYGPWFRTVERLWLGVDEELGELRIPADGLAELDVYALHPGFLDGALQVAAAGMLADGKVHTEPRLPFSVERVEVLGRFAEKMFVHVRGRVETGAEVVLVDDQGRVCVRLSGYLTRAARDLLADICFAPSWVEKPTLGAENPTAREVWLVSGEPTLLEARLKSKHPQSNEIRLTLDTSQRKEAIREVHADNPDAWLDTLQNLPQPDLIYFITGRIDGGDELNRVRRGQERGVLALFRMIKALQHKGWWEAGLRLKVVTRGSAMLMSSEQGEPYCAAVSGLIGSLGREYPEVETVCIDVGDVTPETVASAVAAIENEPAHRQSPKVVWRDGHRYELALWPVDTPQVKLSALRRGGVYVIVGGAGGIGRSLSEHLIRNYGARIAWIGRRSLDQEIEQKLQATASLGGEVIYLQADVTDQPQVDSAFAAVRTRWGRIHGVVHSALVLRDRRFERMQEEDFLAALAPKAVGMAVLARAAKDIEADWLMVFSSVQSFGNNTGQSNYAAASVFADSYARWAGQLLGLPIYVVNWGYWGSVGIVASDRYRTALAEQGMGSIEVSEGMEAVERILAHRVPQLAVVRASAPLLKELGVDYDRRKIVHSVRQRSVFEELKQAISSTEANKLNPDAEAVQRELQGLAELDRLGWFALASQLSRRSLIPAPGNLLDLNYLERRLEVIPRHKRLYAALIGVLARAGFIESTVAGWRVTQALDGPESATSPETFARLNRSYSATYPEFAGHAELLATCVEALPEVLRGATAATQVMFPGGSLRLVEKIYKGTTLADYFNRLAAFALERAVVIRLADLPPGEKLCVVEVGAGTGSTTEFVAAALERHGAQIDYVYSDVSTGFKAHFQRHFADRFPFMRFAVIDLERDLAEQGLSEESVDLVLAANAVHVASNLRRSLQFLKGLLKQNGLLTLIEFTEVTAFNTLTYGLLDGWWHFEDGQRRLPNAPVLSRDQWKRALFEEGFCQIVTAEESEASGVGKYQSFLLAESDGSFLVENSDCRVPMATGSKATPPTERTAKSVIDPEKRHLRCPASIQCCGRDKHGR